MRLCILRFFCCASAHEVLCCYPDLKAVPVNDDIVKGNAENGCQYNDIVQSRHGETTLPLVDRLRGGETENVLQITDRESGILSQAGYIHPGSGHIYDR